MHSVEACAISPPAVVLLAAISSADSFKNHRIEAEGINKKRFATLSIAL